MDLPTIYRINKSGSVQQWTVSIEHNMIITSHGQVGGQIQTISEEIKEGKNVGRSNETTPYEQAAAEALARHQKKIKSGYVLDPSGEGCTLGGVVPMLAQSYDKHAKKINFPAMLQPKLDGMRCIAIFDGTKVTLWSRTRKPITSAPHIIKELENYLTAGDPVIFDGELYADKLSNDFEQIISLARQEVPCVGHEQLEYHVYDMVEGHMNDHRQQVLRNIYFYQELEFIKLVPTYTVNSDQEVMERTANFITDGYEGGIVRNLNGRYLNGRSFDLQKVKGFVEDGEMVLEMMEDDFVVLGVNEGRGKLAGHAGTLAMKTLEGTDFNAKPIGDTSNLKVMFENPGSVIGKIATVRFFGYTGKNNVPKNPNVKCIRDYE